MWWFSFQVTLVLLGHKSENVFWQCHLSNTLTHKFQLTIICFISLWNCALLLCVNGWPYKCILWAAKTKKKIISYFYFLDAVKPLNAIVHSDGLWSLCYWNESPSPGKYNSLRVFHFLDYKQQLYSGQALFHRLSTKKHLREHFETFL